MAHTHTFNNGGEYYNVKVDGTFLNLSGGYSTCDKGHKNCIATVPVLHAFPRWVLDENLQETSSGDEDTIGHTHTYERIKILTFADMLVANPTVVNTCDGYGTPCYISVMGHVLLTYEMEELETTPSTTAGTHAHKINVPSSQYITDEGSWDTVVDLAPCATYGHYNCLAVIETIPGGFGWIENIYEDHWISWEAPIPPSLQAQTLDATNINTTAATLNGELLETAGGGNATCHFDWDTYDWYSVNNTFRNSTSNQSVSVGTFHAHLTGLDSGTWYSFCAIAVEGAEELVCQTLDFATTEAGEITTLPATQVSSLNAILNGLYTGTDPAQLYFHMSTGEMIFYGMGANTYLWTARYGLTPSTTYTFRAVAKIADVLTYGEWLSFTTEASPVYPIVPPDPVYTPDPAKFIFVPKRKLDS